jgi:hypothetical protein
MRPGIPLALRLGDGGVASETESLLHLGKVFDAHHLAATTLAEAICAKIFPQRTAVPSTGPAHRPSPPLQPARDVSRTESTIKGSGRDDK